MAKQPKKTVPKERLSASEWEIMRICWRLGRCTVRDVLKEDLRTHKRDYRTILTFLTRMAGKGWLEVRKDRNVNYYSPAVEQTTAVRSEIERFVHEVVGQELEHLELLSRVLEGKKRKRGR